jgi:two-component system, NarL family, response regulator LiaR
MTTIRLVLADDHHLFRQGLRQLCEIKGGFDVVGEASTGEQAVLLVAELQPDVVLIDINMPQLNGIAATQQIIAANPEARVIVLTMYRQDNYVFEAIKSGARGYLLKNAEAQDLIDGVREVYDGGTLLDTHIAARAMEEFNRLSQIEGRDVMALTEGEMVVLRLVAEGLDNPTIAQRLNLSVQTVANRVRLIYQKLQVNNRTKAALYALRQGWAELDDEG